MSPSEQLAADELAEPRWLSFDDVVDIHHQAMESLGELPRPVIDENRLRSKLTRPINAYHYEGIRDLFLLGAMVAVAISQAHGFEDGNKRTALASLAIFLRRGGHRLNVTDTSVGAWLIAVAEERDRDTKTEEFAAWLRTATSRIP